MIVLNIGVFALCLAVSFASGVIVGRRKKK